MSNSLVRSTEITSWHANTTLPSASAAPSIVKSMSLRTVNASVHWKSPTQDIFFEHLSEAARQILSRKAPNAADYVDMDSEVGVVVHARIPRYIDRLHRILDAHVGRYEDLPLVEYLRRGCSIAFRNPGVLVAYGKLSPPTAAQLYVPGDRLRSWSNQTLGSLA